MPRRTTIIKRYSGSKTSKMRMTKRRQRQRALRKRVRSSRNVGIMSAYPFPQKMYTTLQIVEHNGLISGLTSVASLVYRPTSYFDFYPAVGGPSFGGYATYAGMYDRYRVLAFKYKCTFTNLEADSITVSVQAIADTSTPSSGTAADFTESAIENIYGKYTTLGPVTANPVRTISGYVNCTRLWGTPEVRNDTVWAATTSSSPTANSWLRIAALRNNGATLATGVQFTLVVKSYGVWDERIDKTS